MSGAGIGGGTSGRGPKPRGPKPQPVPKPVSKTPPPRTTGGINNGNENRIDPIYRMAETVYKPPVYRIAATPKPPEPKPSLPPVPPKSVTAKNPNPKPTLKPIKSAPSKTSNKPTPTDVALGRLGTPQTKGGRITSGSGEVARVQPKTQRGTPQELLKKPPVVKPTPRPTPRLLHGNDPHLPKIITYRPKKGNN